MGVEVAASEAGGAYGRATENGGGWCWNGCACSGSTDGGQVNSGVFDALVVAVEMSLGIGGRDNGKGERERKLGEGECG